MKLSYSKIIIMIIMKYQTNTRNKFNGPAATDIGTFDITWLNITRVVDGTVGVLYHSWLLEHQHLNLHS